MDIRNHNKKCKYKYILFFIEFSSNYIYIYIIYIWKNKIINKT